MPDLPDGVRRNLPAALASLIVPGLGQMLQQRWIKGAFMLIVAVVLWVGWMGWLAHLWAAVDAALAAPTDPEAR